MLNRRRSGVVAVVAALVVSTLTTGGPSASARATTPRLRLIRSSGTITQHVGKGHRFRFNPGVYVAALDSPFEVWASRPDYDSPISASQHFAGGGSQALPSSVLTDAWYRGLARFLEVRVFDRSGDEVLDRMLSFCPNTYEPQRIDDSGPVEATYPTDCGYNPFTTGMVWGIDQGWAANVSQASGSRSMKLAPGRYDVSISITPLYRSLFAVAPADAETSMTLRVKRHGSHGGGGGPVPVPIRAASGRHGSARVPTDTDPDPDTLPDLIPLPSYGIDLSSRRNRDILSFGADVWVSGSAPLVVEGFRKEDAALMNAYQYFYDGQSQVGRAPVGKFEYDARHGHTHWHFRQFATYSLLAADETTTVVSEKEAFCLAPTDAIDLTLPGATYRPWPLGLSTACGGPSALWIREVLPLGWGDTYYQGLPGQAFDVTDLPNGTYYIKVQANPGGRLYEQNRGNNVRLRQVRLHGKPGHRRVVVPAWHGIDTERTGFFSSGRMRSAA